MDGERADMVFTDPPYNVAIDGNVSGLGKVSHREFAMASGEMSQEQFTSSCAQPSPISSAIAATGRFISSAWTGDIWPKG
jgi:hypothetical protein